MHGWRDFLLHLGTFTVGLLIALGLEAVAEHIHHQHLVAEARENISREISENHEHLLADLASLAKDAERMRSNIVVVRQLRDHQPHADLHFNVAWSGFTDSAWRTAQSTGAVSFMPYNQLQDFSDLYTQQAYLTTLGANLFTSQSRAPSILAAETSIENLRPDQLAQLMNNLTTLLAEIDLLQGLLPDLDRRYTQSQTLRRAR